MFTISKEFTFDAAHQLIGLPDDHPCTRLHGHTYTVIVELSSPVLNDTGFVLDYRELAMVKRYIDDNLDHRNLNDVLNMNPTAELIAMHIYEYFKELIPRLTAVTVKETPKTKARYEPNS
jgi:6-pyruvoyltetrahydropterin/6-carboxytetrahydropterin synthase